MINSIQTSDIRNLFNPENIYISKEGGGAGNNWASGHTQGEAVQETLLDMFGARARAARVASHSCGTPPAHAATPAPTPPCRPTPPAAPQPACAPTPAAPPPRPPAPPHRP